MKMKLLQDLKNYGPSPPIYFNPNTTIGKKTEKIGLPQGQNQDPTGRGKQRDSIALHPNLQEKKRRGTIGFPHGTKDYF